MKVNPHLIADCAFRTPPRTMIEPDPEVIRRLLAGIDATDIEDTHAPAPPRIAPLRKTRVSGYGLFFIAAIVASAFAWFAAISWWLA